MVSSMEIRKVSNGWTIDVWMDDGDREIFIADSRNDLKNIIARTLATEDKAEEFL